MSFVQKFQIIRIPTRLKKINKTQFYSRQAKWTTAVKKVNYSDHYCHKASLLWVVPVPSLPVELVTSAVWSVARFWVLWVLRAPRGTLLQRTTLLCYLLPPNVASTQWLVVWEEGGRAKKPSTQGSKWEKFWVANKHSRAVSGSGWKWAGFTRNSSLPSHFASITPHVFLLGRFPLK